VQSHDQQNYQFLLVIWVIIGQAGLHILIIILQILCYNYLLDKGYKVTHVINYLLIKRYKVTINHLSVTYRLPIMNKSNVCRITNPTLR